MLKRKEQTNKKTDADKRKHLTHFLKKSLMFKVFPWQRYPLVSQRSSVAGHLF